MRTFVFFIFCVSILAVNGQEYPKLLPYHEISEYPEDYSSNLIVARMIDGLGFRYYWATEGLKDSDLAYKASDSSRSTDEIIDHIYGLSKFIRNSILEKDKDDTKGELNFFEKRAKTLENFKAISDMFKNNTEEYQFESTSVPFWNLINGPISDAIWHCGQIVMLRRASGNPFNSNVSLFKGGLRD